MSAFRWFWTAQGRPWSSRQPGLRVYPKRRISIFKCSKTRRKHYEDDNSMRMSVLNERRLGTSFDEKKCAGWNMTVSYLYNLNAGGRLQSVTCVFLQHWRKQKRSRCDCVVVELHINIANVANRLDGVVFFSLQAAVRCIVSIKALNSARQILACCARFKRHRIRQSECYDDEIFCMAFCQQHCGVP